MTETTFTEPLLASDNAEEPVLVSPAPTLSARRVRFANTSPQRLFNTNKYHRLNIEHVNAQKMSMYLQRDIFHTLLNMPNYRFFFVFICTYITMYSFYAFIYQTTASQHCVSHVNKFSHALWFSVHTAATIGYGHQAPNPDCMLINLTIMAQVLTALLLQAALLGLVYARFSSPGARAATIKFSSILACYRGPDGYRRLAFRVANMRKHQVLQPEVHLLMMRREEVPCALSRPRSNEFTGQHLEYRYHDLKLQHVSGHGFLWLGVPSIMAHRIDEMSPLWDITRAELEQSNDIEFIVLLDGIDEMTSTVMQARKSYFASDIRWDESFAGVLARHQSGTLAADYSHFDLTRLEAEDSIERNGRDVEEGRRMVEGEEITTSDSDGE